MAARSPSISTLLSTDRQRIADSVTALVGMAASIVGSSYLLALALHHPSAAVRVGCLVYCVSLVLLYTVSTLYHSVSRARLRARLRLWDHACIYLLIAGTYTPFTLTWLAGRDGWTLFGVVWALALVGITFKTIFRYRYRTLSVVTYVLMGWSCVLSAGPLLERSPLGGLLWLGAGGIVYTLGVAFFVFDRLPYFHAIWHLFVLGGSACHFLAIAGHVVG